MTKQVSNPGKEFWKSFGYFILGLVVLSGFIIYTVVSTPIFLYRWLICNIIAPLFRRDAGKAVTLGGAIMATELIQESTRTKPRFALTTSICAEGVVTFEEFSNRIRRHWINGKSSTGKGSKYPELQQSIESWMGYLFWKQDKDFNLENHLIHHICKESWTEMECEQYVCSIVEDLINKPFPKGRSPWEVNVISYFRDSKLLSDGREMSIAIFRFHHCIADGFAIFSLFCDGLVEIPFSSLTVAQMSSPKSVTNGLRSTINFLSFPIQVIQELGYAGSLILCPVKTPWYVTEGERTGRQLYVRSGRLPISKLKFVKNKFGVGFTSTLLSCISAGIASSFKSKGFPNHIKDLPFGSPLPLKGHPHKLRNHWTAALYKICIDQTLSPLERLKESEKHFQAAKQSTYPYLFQISLKLAALQFPVISKAMATNRTLSTGLTNFPGPGVTASGFGRDAVVIDGGAGLLYGVAGLGFMVVSYNGYIRISIVAENAAMERDELNELIKTICNEIDKLYDLARCS